MRASTAMQAFHRALARTVPRITRLTRTTVTLAMVEGAVVLTARWGVTTLSGPGEHRVVFDRRRVLGSTASLPPLQQRLAKKVCQLSDDAVAEVLRARGV